MSNPKSIFINWCFLYLKSCRQFGATIISGVISILKQELAAEDNIFDNELYGASVTIDNFWSRYKKSKLYRLNQILAAIRHTSVDCECSKVQNGTRYIDLYISIHTKYIELDWAVQNSTKS
eukprot:NODE_425_length_8856_cov_0.734841.p5 type:complete len:121 gc:universal NODE_425_length_8856_cov_0.734841:2067-2429(+)